MLLLPTKLAPLWCLATITLLPFFRTSATATPTHDQQAQHLAVPWWDVPLAHHTFQSLSHQHSLQTASLMKRQSQDYAAAEGKLASESFKLSSPLDEQEPPLPTEQAALSASWGAQELGELRNQQLLEWYQQDLGYQMQFLRLSLEARARQRKAATEDRIKNITSHGKGGGRGGGEGGEEGSRSTHICFVVRTYVGHGPVQEGGGSYGDLFRLLNGFLKSEHEDWNAQLIIADKLPFHSLPLILAGLGDDPRITLFSQQEGDEFQAKLEDGNWNPLYHDILYGLTDQAIRACPSHTDWVVITNGDNEYDRAFMPALVKAAEDRSFPSLVAFDYYSRYQRINGEPCQRLGSGPGAPLCKDNLLRFCQTDLSSVAFDWQRFMAEERSFLAMAKTTLDSQQGLHDALLTESLLLAGWEPFFVQGTCLVDHSPSPQACALEGGVWDDREVAGFATSGGRCLTMEEAMRSASKEGHPSEVVTVSITLDDMTFRDRRESHAQREAASNGTPVNTEAAVPQLLCLRRPFTPPWRDTFYPKYCSAPQDWPANFGVPPAVLLNVVPGMVDRPAMEEAAASTVESGKGSGDAGSGSEPRTPAQILIDPHPVHGEL